MTLTEEKVNEIARLARIKLTGAETKKYQDEINYILGWMKQLEEVNTEGVEPMTAEDSRSLLMRSDEILPQSERPKREEILANAPNAKYGYFVVNKVIE